MNILIYWNAFIYFGRIYFESEILETIEIIIIDLDTFFSLFFSLYWNCSNAVTLFCSITRQSGIFFRIKQTYKTVEICTKTHQKNEIQQKNIKTKRKSQKKKNWKYLSLGYAANMNGQFRLLFIPQSLQVAVFFWFCISILSFFLCKADWMPMIVTSSTHLVQFNGVTTSSMIQYEIFSQIQYGHFCCFHTNISTVSILFVHQFEFVRWNFVSLPEEMYNVMKNLQNC